ncbi:hypothetical protein LTR07_009421 [Exophiala xenobiotica]|uniref:Epoxide hydrolase N-terminal domain-containing protein n=1 Tax=Vermiconidia calcicola TaxID=1690605 RepID=A0AAV9Q009_9PEZI|nr:hypothetical protein LTR34_010576 [Exophiala xenobiotica]KAK5511063.1 hypothetical protein LTR07_009421 [Exophiala xenobiotica]KAK5530363.1 hypothetical protein LTR25_008941 [Vermiconidia calcicola]KAK5552405.1 hypothetical protein LTR46_009452 [Exophiala xenobiotica]
MDFGNLPQDATDDFRPFVVDTPQTDIDALKTLLRLSKVGPKTYENSLPDGRLGLQLEWLQQAVKQWSGNFDWLCDWLEAGFTLQRQNSWSLLDRRKSEEHINSFPNYISSIRDDDGRNYDIHFTALFSKNQDAVPILLLHGWPGSFLEFLPILEKLRHEYNPETLPYHLIVPSLPGYGFSSAPPPDQDMRLEDAARLLDKMMVLLGFGNQGYVVQGGDVGSKVARVIAAEHDNCKAIHINFCIMPEPAEDQIDKRIPVSQAEEEGLHRTEWFKRTGSAYALEHATRPSTIGFALGSSPISLLAWIAEKFLEWTDEDPPIDLILESVTLYWLTDSASTSLWPYRQLFTPGVIGAHENPGWRIPDHKPFGFSWFPMELAPIPQAWAATTGKLSFYRQHDKGGHFAAVEKPDELWNDISEFVDQAWNKSTT